LPLHLEEEQEDWHTRLNVEERTQNFKGTHHGPTARVKLGRGSVQVLKKNTMKSGQGKNEVQDLKQTRVHEKKKGQTSRRRSQEREVITPVSLDDHLVGILRVFMFYLAFQSKNTRRREEGKLILQNIVPHPLIAATTSGDDGDQCYGYVTRREMPSRPYHFSLLP